MSDSRPPARQAIDKAFEGVHLLAIRDYEGAIKACTEAIELEPGMHGAYLTRAEAYDCLARKREVADHQHVTEKAGSPRLLLCARLRDLGRERLIDLDEGPIRQVLIGDLYIGGQPANPYHPIAYHKWARSINYLVPDPRIEPDFSSRSIQSTAVRRGFGGPGIGHRWKVKEGNDKKKNRALWAEVISRLNQDGSLTAGIAEANRRSESRLIIRVIPSRGCWAITHTWDDVETSRPFGSPSPPNLADSVAKHVPSRLEWDCYQAIAEHLLAAPVSSEAWSEAGAERHSYLSFFGRVFMGAGLAGWTGLCAWWAYDIHRDSAGAWALLLLIVVFFIISLTWIAVTYNTFYNARRYPVEESDQMKRD